MRRVYEVAPPRHGVRGVRGLAVKEVRRGSSICDLRCDDADDSEGKCVNMETVCMMILQKLDHCFYISILLRMKIR